MDSGLRRDAPVHTVDLVVRVGTVEREVTATIRAEADLGDLVDALAPAHARIDRADVAGMAVGVDTPLAAVGLVDGTTIELVSTPAGEPSGLRPDRVAAVAAMSGVVVAIVGGVDAGRSIPVPIDATGRRSVVVGADPTTDVPVADPTVSTRHARIELLAGAGVTVTDLGSLNGIRLDGKPVHDRLAAPAGSVISLGATDLMVRAVADDSAPARLRSGPFNRPPRVRPPGAVDAVAVPDPPIEGSRTAFDLVALIGPILVGAVMVVVLGSIRYAAFALMGPLLLIVSQVSQRRRSAKESRSSARRFRRELDEFVAALAAAGARERARLEQIVPDPAEIVRRATSGSTRLWERRADHVDHLVLRLGRGARPWTPPVDAERVRADPALAEAVSGASALPRCPIEVDLCDDAVIGIVGHRAGALALARSLVLQAAVLHGPADLSVDVAVDPRTASDWTWASWLPHARVGSEGAGHRVRCAAAAARAAAMSLASAASTQGAFGGAGGAGATPMTATSLLVVDAPNLIAGRGAPVRRLLGSPTTVGVVIAATVEGLPGCVSTVVRVDDLGDSVVERPGAGWSIPQVVIAGVGESVARTAARALAAHEDPEVDDVAAAVPTTVALLDLLGPAAAGPEAIASSWSGATRCATAIGLGAAGPVVVDLDADGPHVLVGGTTGSGKSELLRTLIAGLAAGSSPDHLVFVLLDYKGGSAFDACAALPHVVGLVTDLDHQLGARALRSLEAELRLRERCLRDAGADGLDAYRRAGSPRGPMPRLVVVVDEFAALAVELPEFLGALVGVAQRGRSLGVHLVLATQRPSGVISADIRANTNLRIALRVHDAGDSVDVIDRRDAAAIDRSTPGRAYVRVGPGDPALVQTALATSRTAGRRRAPVRVAPRVAVMVDTAGTDDAHVGADNADDLAVLVERCRAAWAAAGVAPRRPWIEMLPTRIGREDLDTPSEPGLVAIALADDPDHQRRTTTSWDPAAGHLGVFGAVGSGTTNALRSILTDAIARWSAAQCWIYVFDHGGELESLASAPQVGAVVGGDERERRLRLVAFLHRCLEERRAGTSGIVPERIVVAIDQLPALFADLDGAETVEVAAQLRRVLADGPAFGIVAVLSAERPAAVPTAVLASVTERYLLRLADPMDAAGAGFRPHDLPSGDPGRGLHVGSRLVVQFPLMVDGAPTGRRSGDAGPGRPWCAHGEGAPPIRCLPDTVTSASLPAARVDAMSASLPVGIGEPDLTVCELDLRVGDHLLVAGTARSGVSSTLRFVLQSLRGADPAAVVVVVADDRSPLRRDGGIVDALGTVDQLGDVLDRAVADTGRRWLVVVDDAHRISEAPGLERLERLAHCRMVVGGRSDRLGSMFGHWTRSVRAGGMGILLHPRLDADGELLGVRLPRSTAAPLAAGRGFVVAGGDASLVQVGLPRDQPSKDIDVA